MYENIGLKLKGLATVWAAIGMIASFIGGLVMMTAEYVGAGWAILILGSLLSWISGMFTYGFGQLIENSDQLVHQATENSDRLVHQATENSVNMPPANNISTVLSPTETWKCPSCGTAQPAGGTPCSVCGHPYVNQKHIPVKPIKNADGMITCPTCSTVQRADRTLCYNCEQVFDLQ